LGGFPRVRLELLRRIASPQPLQEITINGRRCSGGVIERTLFLLASRAPDKQAARQDQRCHHQ